MATTTRSRQREMLARAIGFFFSGTNTGTANNTVIDVDIALYDTGRLTNLWVFILTGNRAGEARRISSVSSSTVTVTSAFSGVMANGDTFEILPFDPLDIHDALQEATRTVWPKRLNGRAARGLYLPTTDETLVVDNLIANWDFETGTFTSWTAIGGATLTANTSYFVHGVQSANIAGSADAGMEQNLLTSAYGFARIDQAAGKTLQIRGWLRATDASNVRLRVTFNGTTYTNGSYHSGDDDWEGPFIHTISVTIPANATEMTVSIEKSTGVAAQADMVVAWIDPRAEYTMPTAFYPNGPARVLVQRYFERPMGLYAPLGSYGPYAGAVLRLEGPARLTVPTTDAGTTEVDENEAELIIAEAASILYHRQSGINVENRERYLFESQRWEARANELRASVGHLLPSADERIGWRISPEESRLLYLSR